MRTEYMNTSEKPENGNRGLGSENAILNPTTVPATMNRSENK